MKSDKETYWSVICGANSEINLQCGGRYIIATIVMTNTELSALNMQIEVLKQEIELEESNYKYAVELGKDYGTLLLLRDHIMEQKQRLYALIQTTLNIETKKIE